LGKYLIDLFRAEELKAKYEKKGFFHVYIDILSISSVSYDTDITGIKEIMKKDLDYCVCLSNFTDKDKLNISNIDKYYPSLYTDLEINSFVHVYEFLNNLSEDVNTKNHTHFILPTGIIALWAKKKFGLHYIITAHGSDVPGYNTDRLKFAHRFTGPFLRRVCDGANTIVTSSEYLMSLIRKNIRSYDEGALVRIPNGVDSDAFMPGEKRKDIVATGRFLRRKGFRHLIAAVSEADIGYEVHICGDGPMRSELKKAAELSKTKIIFHGWMDNTSPDYRRILGSAAIYCLLSSSENASIALLEGMSAGCAIVATDIPACREMVGEAGFFVKPGDIEDIQEKILNLIDHSQILISYQQASRKRVLEHYHWDVLVNKYEVLLK